MNRLICELSLVVCVQHTCRGLVHTHAVTKKNMIFTPQLSDSQGTDLTDDQRTEATEETNTILC